VVHAAVDRSGHQVVGDADGVNVAGQVEVEVLHGDDLRVAAAGRTAFDAKGRPLRWLADAADHVLAQHAQALSQADRGGRLAFSKWGWRDGRHINVLAGWPVGVAFDDIQMHFGFVLAEGFEIIDAQAQTRGNVDDRLEFGCLGNIQVAWHRVQAFHAVVDLRGGPLRIGGHGQVP